MSSYDVNQIKSGFQSLQLSVTKNTSFKINKQLDARSDPSMISPDSSLVSKQDNQNAAALPAREGIAIPHERTQYAIAQENGQRRYGPSPEWIGENPQRGCEVFIGKIPRDCFEDELLPIFERIGPIFMFRLMMEFNGTNRGYGFCVYTNREDTKRAVDELNNYEIRKGKTIGVCLSVDNCRLFVGGIPKNKTREEIFIEMQKVTDGVKDVISYPSIADKTKNRGFAFVEYDSHKAAAMARRKLIPGRIQLWGQQIAVDWAEPEREVNEDIMSKVKILYVRNLMLSTSEEELREYFISVGGGDQQCIERVKKISDYAFIHFKDRDVAQLCLETLNGTEIDGSIIEITWAKPADKGDTARSQSSRSSKQMMEWSMNGDIANTANLFIDPTSAMLAGSNNSTPFFLPQMAANCSQGIGQLLLPNSASGSIRTGRRNAAGGRSAAAQRDRKHPVEFLEELCQRSGWDSPIYMAMPVDVIDYTSGSKVQLFAGQVTIPGLRLQFHAPRCYETVIEAKAGAAEAAVYSLNYNQLQYQFAIPDFNGTFPSSLAGPGCVQSIQSSIGSLLPMVIPQNANSRNGTYPSLSGALSCPTALYSTPTGSMAGSFSSILPLLSTENAISLNQLQSIQLQSQLFEYQQQLVRNQLTAGLIPTGTFIVDQTIGGPINSQQCPGTSGLSNINSNPENVIQNDLSLQTNLNDLTQFNNASTSSKARNLVPIIPPIVSALTTVPAAMGQLNYHLPLSTSFQGLSSSIDHGSMNLVNNITNSKLSTQSLTNLPMGSTSNISMNAIHNTTSFSLA